MCITGRALWTVLIYTKNRYGVYKAHKKNTIAYSNAALVPVGMVGDINGGAGVDFASRKWV